MKYVVSLVFVLAAFTLVASPHPIMVEDLFSMERVSSPVLSPDGTKVAYVVDRYSMEENNHVSHLWILDLDTGETRQLTFGEDSDSTPRWSMDGKELYFLSSRNGSSQVYALPMEGGEARPVTDIPMDVEDLVPSPDGKALFLWISLYQECGTDWSCNKKKIKEAEDSRVKARAIDQLLYRHWNHWVEETVSRLVLYDLATGISRELTPGQDPTPPMALNGPYPFAVSPDGTTAVYVVNHEEKTATSTNHDLYLLDLAKEKRRNLTSTNLAWDDSPRFSPDGKSLAYLKMDLPGYEADQTDLILRDLTSGKEKNLTEKFDRSVDTYLFSPGGETLYFLAGDRGYREIFSIWARGGEVKQLTNKKNVSDIVISPDGEFLVCVIENSAMPRELFTMDLSSGDLVRRTFQNREVIDEIRWGDLEEITYPSADGTGIHGFLLKPPDFNQRKKYPLILLAHGGPQGAWEDDFHYRWNLQMFAAPGYVVFAPNFRGSTGYGAAFKEAISGDWGGKPYEDIMSGVDYVLKNCPYVDGKKMAVAGASYGGYMVNWIATQTDRFSSLVSHAGLFDVFSKYGSTEELWFPEWEFKGNPYENPELYRKFSPSTYVKNINTPMLVIHGANDFRVAENQAFQLFTALQRMGVESRFLYFPDEDHFIRKPLNAKRWWREVYDWIRNHM